MKCDLKTPVEEKRFSSSASLSQTPRRPKISNRSKNGEIGRKRKKGQQNGYESDLIVGESEKKEEEEKYLERAKEDAW